jgi:ammonium transporter, Amt family
MTMTFLRYAIAIAGVSLAYPAAAQPMIVADSGDTAWMLTASVLVLLAALPGLALFHGRSRAGALGAALFVTTAGVSLLFALIGYSLMFSAGTSILGGLDAAMLADLAELQDGTTISEPVYALFELALAVLAVSILVASVAERARFGWLALFAPLWFLVVYVPVSRWVAGGGWLAELGAIDYAGGLVIQTSAGVAALVAGLLLGRAGDAVPGHDAQLSLAGLALVWVGWFGIVGGAALGASGDSALAMLNAQLAASAAALTGLALQRVGGRVISIQDSATMAIAGLAAISAGAASVGTLGAIALGVIGALAAGLAAMLVRPLDIGDAGKTFVVHGAGGMAGALAFPLFVLPVFGGPGFDEGTGVTSLLIAQAVAVGSVALWTVVVTAIAALMVSMVIPMRCGDRP